MIKSLVMECKILLLGKLIQGSHMTIYFAPKALATAQAVLQQTRRAQCDQMSLYHYNAVLSDVKDKFQESERFR